MSELQARLPGQRLLSLDAFRGITIAGMILVNNPGSWSHVYGPLRHADWNGLTPTDLVFPFFLYIVGVALAFALPRRLAESGRAAVLSQIARRAVILFMLGLVMAGFPDVRLFRPYLLVILGVLLLWADRPVLGPGRGALERTRKAMAWLLLVAAVVCFGRDFGHFQEAHLRVPGVLQRIALCYACAALILLRWGPYGRAVWVVALLAGYWVLALHVAPPPGYEAPVSGWPGLLHDWIDTRLLGAHIYRERPDPEGLLSTLPAIATTLLGVFAGEWLRAARDPARKAAGLFFAANVALVLGLCLNYGFPINKKIWSSSYVVFTAGLAMHFLAMCYWLIDVHGRRRWAWPFLVFGSNAIAVYVASSLTAKLLGRLEVATAAGATVTVKTWLYEHLFRTWADPLPASLAFAIAYVLVWLVPLIPLYRWRILIRI